MSGHGQGCPCYTCQPINAALPPVRSEPLLAWIRSVLTTMDGKPMSIGTDTATEIVRRIDSHANAPLERSARSDDTLGGKVGR
jgi:hypothetical protein